MGLLFRLSCNPLVWRLSAGYTYRRQTAKLAAHDVSFLNLGYEESPAMGLVLDPTQEHNRAAIQLYHRTASQVDLTAKRVLEVGCGHGGGAAYLTAALAPSSYVAMDLNPEGIVLCRRYHRMANLRFVEGDAQKLPVADASFDAVVNIESSHCYPDFGAFLVEVARVLVPGGHLLYADLRTRRSVSRWERQLASGPLRVIAANVVNDEVLRGLDLYWGLEQNRRRFDRLVTPVLRRIVWESTGAPGSAMYRALQDREMSYRMYCLVN